MWPWRRKNNHDRAGRGGPCPPVGVPADKVAQVVAEAAAVVEGRSALRLAASGRPVPGWAWLNTLAHQPPHELAGLVDTAVSKGRATRAWAAAATDIAATLGRLDAVDGAAIQANLLVPLELTVLAGYPLPDPARLAGAVRHRAAALQQQHPSERHPGERRR